MAIEYVYNFDPLTYEVFPPEIYNDPYIVFHGTSSRYSENIEANGMVTGSVPFDLDAVEELISILQLKEMMPYDRKIGIMNAAQGLSSYVSYIRSGNGRLSFSYLSYSCSIFASGPLKGGQITGTIRRAKEYIAEAIKKNILDSNLITSNVSALFANIDSHDSERGVIYAIKLPEDLAGISIEQFIIYSSQTVPVARIIGKVYVPNEYDPSSFNWDLAISKNREKFLHPYGLGAVYYGKNE